MSKKTSLPSKPPVRCIRLVGRRSNLWRELRDGYEAAVIRAGHSKRFAHKHATTLADLSLAESSNGKDEP